MQRGFALKYLSLSAFGVYDFFSSLWKWRLNRKETMGQVSVLTPNKLLCTRASEAPEPGDTWGPKRTIRDKE